MDHLEPRRAHSMNGFALDSGFNFTHNRLGLGKLVRSIWPKSCLLHCDGGKAQKGEITFESHRCIASHRSSVVAPLYRTLKSDWPFGAARKGTFATGNVSDCRATPTTRPPPQRNRPQNIDIHRFPRHIGYLLIEWAHNLMIRDSSRGKFVCVRRFGSR